MNTKTPEPTEQEPAPQPEPEPERTETPESSPHLNIPLIARLHQRILFLGVILVLILSVALVYAYTIAPRQAPKKYFDRITNAKSFKQSGQLSIRTEQDETVQDTGLNFDGVYKVNENNIPNYLLDVDGHAAYAGSNSKFAGAIISVNGATYVRATKPALLENFLPGLLNQWFIIDQAKCSIPDLERIQNVIEDDILNKLPLSSQKRLSLFADKIDGQQATRYSGSVDVVQLAKILTSAASKLETVCGQAGNEAARANTKQAIEDLGQNSQITYELATGKDFDKLVVNTTSQKNGSESKAVLTLVTSDYDKPVEVTAPVGAVPFEEFLAQKAREKAQQQSQINTGPGSSAVCPRGVINCTLDSAFGIVDTALTGVQGILNTIFGARR